MLPRKKRASHSYTVAAKAFSDDALDSYQIYFAATTTNLAYFAAFAKMNAPNAAAIASFCTVRGIDQDGSNPFPVVKICSDYFYAKKDSIFQLYLSDIKNLYQNKLYLRHLSLYVLSSKLHTSS